MMTTPRIPSSGFRVILADPPWRFGNVRTGGTMKSGSAHKYATLSVAELEALPVSTWADATGSVLALWAPTALKPEGLAVLTAWGFTYKTTVYWVKNNAYGMGFWFRNVVEECLIGVRGRVRPFRSAQRNVIHHPRLQHSEKPVTLHTWLEPMVGPPRLELFARQYRSGWYGWGLDLGVDVRIIPPRPLGPCDALRD